jgi:hypothetical protein
MSGFLMIVSTLQEKYVVAWCRCHCWQSGRVPDVDLCATAVIAGRCAQSNVCRNSVVEYHMVYSHDGPCAWGLQKAGKEATGILSTISKANGFNSVSDMLEKIPEATRTQLVVKVSILHLYSLQSEAWMGSKLTTSTRLHDIMVCPYCLQLEIESSSKAAFAAAQQENLVKTQMSFGPTL